MSVERKWLFTLIQIIFIHAHDSEYRYSVAKKGDFSNNMLENNRVIFSYYFFNPENLNKSEIANLFKCFSSVSVSSGCNSGSCYCCWLGGPVPG